VIPEEEEEEEEVCAIFPVNHRGDACQKLRKYIQTR